MANVIDDLCGIISSDSECIRRNELSWYSSYLKGRHEQLHISRSSCSWLPSPTHKVFNLAIIKKEIINRGKIDDDFVRKTIRGQVDDILLKKSPIALEDMLDSVEEARKVVLIDGAPGSGKSTLAIHICQKWSKGELFQEYTIVILVQLRDPAVQSAQAITDLMPCRDEEMAHQIASTIRTNDGKDVLWVLDGWDELPPHLQKQSLLRDIIIPPLRSPIAKCSVIVTSRPISSGELCKLVSARIEVLGFTEEIQQQYFTECLNGNMKSVSSLLERLKENPAMEGSCYLPLNASIVAHLYLAAGSLPTTAHGIFSSLVQHCLSRYMHDRLGKTQDEASFNSLNTIPVELQAPFNNLCKLAFLGVKENRVTFSIEDLASFHDVCEIGLLQATPSLLSNRNSFFYHFLHLSVQEVLAAYYISTMSASEQIFTFQSLFGNTRFSAVFQFYSAITKLRTARPLLSRVPRMLNPIPSSVLDIVGNIILKQKNLIYTEQRPLLVSLLHCLYEAQDLSLCHFIAGRLGKRLNFGDSRCSLYTVDFIAIGYFLSSLSVCINSAKVFQVDLDNCSLGDNGTRSLMQSICKDMNPYTTIHTYIIMYLNDNEIGEEGASHIAEMLSKTRMVRNLSLKNNPGISDAGATLIARSLQQNNVLRTLSLSKCGITSKGVKDIAVAITEHPSLKRLLIHNNSFSDEGVAHLAEGLKHNQTLKYVDIRSCDITDIGVAFLADALCINTTLKVLYISGSNVLTEHGLTSLTEALSRNSRISELRIPANLKSFSSAAQKTINKTRRARLPSIKIESEFF